MDVTGADARPDTAEDSHRTAVALARYEELRPALEGDVPLARLAREMGIAERTARRRVAAYRTHGLAGLERRGRSDRTRAHTITPALQQLIEGLALQTPHRSLAAITRLAADVARGEGWRPASYDQVRRIVGWLDPALLTLARAGEAAYADAFDLLYRRQATRPNEIWQADHTPLKMHVRGDDGQPIRPWLTVVEDDYSRAIAGWRLSLDPPTALHTALALRDAIGRCADPRTQICGIPDAFSTDHGSDFTSHHIEQVAADLHVQLIFSQAGKPRGRGKVERFFRTVEQLFLCQQLGDTPRGDSPSVPGLTLPELTGRFRDWLLDDYQHRVHGETGETPATRWATGGFLPRLPDSPEQLDLLLLTVPTTRRVQQDGIRFHRRRYLDTTLAAYIGEDVTIRYDPADLGELRVFHDGRFLCRAVCPELAGETVGLKEIIGARDRRRRALRAQLTERAAVVEALTAYRRGDAAAAGSPPAPDAATSPARRLKRYRNE